MFKEGECYNNAFMLMGEHLRDKSLRGVIGYVLSSDGSRKLAVRHCWLKRTHPRTRQEEVIDVTVFADGYDPMSVQNFDYIEVQVLDPMEWNDLTAANDNCPSLTGLEGEAGIISDLKADGYEVHD